jgi:hypothetical protein
MMPYWDNMHSLKVSPFDVVVDNLRGITSVSKTSSVVEISVKDALVK